MKLKDPVIDGTEFAALLNEFACEKRMKNKIAC